LVISVWDEVTMNTSFDLSPANTRSSIPPVISVVSNLKILNLPFLWLMIASVGLPSSFSVA
jgi:hypothetical protein